jgi:hypothetical protein
MNIDIDTNFIRSFETNFKRIKEAIAQYSGKHAINKTKSEIFINSQLSPLRRELAKSLIDNTIYITLKEIYHTVEQLILKLYNEYKLNDKPIIYFYSGNVNKSSYFLNVIALHFIRKYKFKEPIFLKELKQVLSDETNPPIVLLDDVAYSGSQMSVMINKIYVAEVLKKQKQAPDLYILLCALTDISKDKLSNVPTKITKSGITLEYGTSPFKLIYLESRLYTSLINILGIEKYIFLNLLFSFWTSPVYMPYISLYLDHKIADHVSTYTTALTYGPIAPKNISFDYSISSDYTPNISEIPSAINKTKLLDDYNRENHTNLTIKNFNTAVHSILQKFKDLDIVDIHTNNNYIQFQPFIESCCENKNILAITTNRDIQRMNYFLFFIPPDCLVDKTTHSGLHKNNECSIPIIELSDETINEFFIDDDALIESTQDIKSHKKQPIDLDAKIKEIKHNVKLITDVKCPFAWYKKGYFGMQEVIKSTSRSTRKVSKSLTKSKVSKTRSAKKYHTI